MKHRIDRSLAALITSVLFCVACRTHAISVASVAADLDITPESLVLAELQDSASLILSRIQNAAELRASLESLRQNADTVSESVTQLAMVVQSDPADSSIAAQYQAAVSQLAAICQQMSGKRDELRALALDGISPAQVQKLAIWTGGDGCDVPAQLRARERSVGQWEQIELALRAEKRAEIRGEELDEPDASVLASVRSEPEVTDAAQRLLDHLDATVSAFSEYESE